MPGSVKCTKRGDRLGTDFHPSHPTATVALLEHGFAGAFDDPGSHRNPRSPIAGVIEAVVVKREIGFLAGYGFLGCRRSRRQGFPHRVEDRPAFMAKPMKDVLRPHGPDGLILGPHRMGYSPTMLTGMITIENFHPRLTRHA